MTNKNDKEIKVVKKPKKIENNPDIELIKSLEDLGLGQNEAIIYIYLLRRGVETGGSKIALGTQIHRQYVYITLEKLIGSGLVVPIKDGVHNKYKAVPPTQIEKLARKKLDVAGDVAQRLSQISSLGREQDFEIFVGEKNIKSYLMGSLKNSSNNSNEYIIGGSSKLFSEIMGDDLEEYLDIKSKHGISVRYLGTRDDIGFYEKTIAKYSNQEYKFFSDLDKNSTHMLIQEKSVSFFSFLNPPLVYIIKSETIAQSYRDFFMMLWNMISNKTS